MDFLDPRKKRSYHIRLMVGYALMAIAIGLGALILVYGAYGYGINTKTGDVISNGLLFVDSKPNGAQIYLNGRLNQATTSARLVLPAGNYSLTIKKTGYRDWTRKFTLDEHTIQRFEYPLLFPVKPVVSDLKTYLAQPEILTQTPDQKWLLSMQPSDTNFDEFDTTALTQLPQVLPIPADLLTGGSAGLSVVAWASDNDHVLLKHDYQGGSEYILFNRSKPENSLNLNKLFKVSFTRAVLFNNKADQIYLFDQPVGTVAVADVATGLVDPVLLQHVLYFQPVGTDYIIYVTDYKVPPSEVSVKIWNNGNNYNLYNMPPADKYLLDGGQYSGHWYFAAGSDKDARINVYQDPINDIKNPNIAKALPVLSLNLLGASKISFSDNARLITAESGQQFSAYDLETQSSYAYSASSPVVAPLGWMDGNRLMGQTGDSLFVMDGDGANQQLVTFSANPSGAYLSADLYHLFTYAHTDSGFVLENVDMRAGTDLPKNISN